MEKLINKILLLCALVGVVFGAYAYVTEKPSALIGEQKKDLEAQIDKVETSLRVEMKERRESRDREIEGIKATITAAEGKVMDKLEKIDDRLFEIQRRQSQESAASWSNSPDGT